MGLKSALVNQVTIPILQLVPIAPFPVSPSLSPLSGSRLRLFFYRDASSALLQLQLQLHLVNQ